MTDSRAAFWELGEWMGGLGRNISFDGCFKHTLFSRKGQGDLDALHINKQLWIPDSDIKAVENTKAFIKPVRLDDTCSNDFRGDNKDRPAMEYRNVSMAVRANQLYMLCSPCSLWSHLKLCMCPSMWQNAVNAMMAMVCPHQITVMSCDCKKGTTHTSQNQ